MLALLVLIPAAVAAAHFLAFGTVGFVFPLVAAIAGLGVAMVIRKDPARGRKWMIGAAAGVLVLDALGLSQGLSFRNARGRIEAALADVSPCVAEGVLADFAVYGTEAEREQAKKKVDKCVDVRFAERCSKIASDVQSRTLTDEDRRWLGDEALRRSTGPKTEEVVQRLSHNELVLDDLKLIPTDLLCREQLWMPLVSGLSKASKLWSDATDLSDAMKQSLTVAGLSPDSRSALRAHGERANDLNLCYLVRTLHADPGPVCQALLDARMEAATHAPTLPPGAAPLRDGGFMDAAEVRDRWDGYRGCLLDCGKKRTPAEADEDLRRAREANARSQECFKKCKGEFNCRTECEGPPQKSTTAQCQLQCRVNHPPPPLTPEEPDMR